jgi:hypothetical protein
VNVGGTETTMVVAGINQRRWWSPWRQDLISDENQWTSPGWSSVMNSLNVSTVLIRNVHDYDFEPGIVANVAIMSLSLRA